MVVALSVLLDSLQGLGGVLPLVENLRLEYAGFSSLVLDLHEYKGQRME